MRSLLRRWGYGGWEAYGVPGGATVAWPAWSDLLPVDEKERRWPVWRLDCDLVAAMLGRLGYEAEARTTHITPYVRVRVGATHCWYPAKGIAMATDHGAKRRQPVPIADMTREREKAAAEREGFRRDQASGRYQVACTYVAALTRGIDDQSRMPASWRERVDAWVAVAFARLRHLHPEWTSAMLAAHVTRSVTSYQGLTADRTGIELSNEQERAVLAPLPAWFLAGGYVESETGVYVR